MPFDEKAIAAEQAVEAKLAEAGAGEVRRHQFADTAAPEEGTPAEPAPDERPRDEQGRFTAEETAQEAPEAEEEAPAPEGDPAVATVLSKYGSDPEKLAQAYAALQVKLGEQASELGQHRQQSGEYQALLQEITQLKATLGQQQYPVDTDWFDQQILDNPYQTLEEARARGDVNLMRRGIQTWKETDPFAASQYVTDLRIQEARDELEQRFQNPPVSGEAQMQTALVNVLGQHQEFNQYADALNGVIARYPGVAQGLTGTLQEKEAAIEVLFALAERDTLRALALGGQTPAEPHAETQVATPTTSETREEPPAKTGTDLFREQFKEEADRLTRGGFVAH